jgi:hypothetical protein
MSKFKVGDVVIVFNSVLSWVPDGSECVVIGEPFMHMFAPAEPSYPLEHNGNSVAWYGSCMRLKRPKDDAEPRSDFTPCDKDFSEWMKKLGRVGA